MGTWRNITMTCFPSLRKSRILSNELLLLRLKRIGKYHKLGVSFQKIHDLVLEGTILSVVIIFINHTWELFLSFWLRFNNKFWSLCFLLLFRSFLILTFGRIIMIFSSKLLRWRRVNCIHLGGLNKRISGFGFRHNWSRSWGRSGWAFGPSWRWWGLCLNWTNHIINMWFRSWC